MYFNIKPWSNNTLQSKEISAPVSKPPVVTSSNDKLYHLSSPNTPAISRSTSSSRSHQTLQSTPKPVTKHRPNPTTQSNYKYHQVTNIKYERPSTNAITTVSSSISSTTIHPKFRPMVSSKITTNPTLKATVKMLSHSTQYSKSTSKETPQPIIHHQQSNIIANKSSNSFWNKKCMNITQIVLNRIDYLQNPKNCSTARKVICGRAGAGMGSTVHHWVYCLIYAYYTNRTMIIDASQWLYLKNVISKDGVNDFHDLFQSISKCKYTIHDKKTAVNWNSSSMDSIYANKTPQVIRLETVGILSRDLKVAPTTCHYSMPAEIFYNILKFKYKPMAWWTGLLSQYIIRPNSYLQQFIDQSRMQFQFQSPIVGVHIRRTDKVEESKPFNIDQYMIKVKLYFDNLAKRKINIKRRVFVITDEPQLISQLKLRYSKYQFIHPPLQQLKAGTFTTRYSAVNLKHFMRDVYLLAECDYLVVTMSSNVGRLAYELHEAIYSRTQSQDFTSLDSKYYIHGQGRSIKGPWIMQAKQDCHTNVTNGINLINGDILDSCVSLDNSRTKYRCYSQRLKKSGSLPASCVNYLLDDDRTYLDYDQVDKLLQPDKFNQHSNHNIQNICTKSSIHNI